MSDGTKNPTSTDVGPLMLVQITFLLNTDILGWTMLI